MRTQVDVAKAVDFIETVCEQTTERDVVEAFVVESSRNGEWVSSIGGEIGPGNSSGARGYPANLPGAAFPWIRGADGIGSRLRVKGGGHAAGIDLWRVLSRQVASSDIKILYSSPAKKLLTDKGEGVTGVVANGGDKDIRVRAKRAVVLTCGGFECNQMMHKTSAISRPD